MMFYNLYIYCVFFYVLDRSEVGLGVWFLCIWLGFGDVGFLLLREKKKINSRWNMYFLMFVCCYLFRNSEKNEVFLIY